MVTKVVESSRPNKRAGGAGFSPRRSVGFFIALVGMGLAAVALIANLVAADRVATGGEASSILAWSFGLNTAAFATIKVAIVTVLIGILVLLRWRVDSAKAALAGLKPDTEPVIGAGAVSTKYGPATTGAGVPKPLPIHTMARRLWAPMAALGYMAVLVGLIVSFVWADDPASVPLAAWTAGLQFLGEGLLLAGIAFLLGTVLATLRQGGAEVQASLGLTVKTLKMPVTAKAFVALMALGVMVSMAQFVLYLVVASGVTSVAAWLAWLGPLREIGLGLILSGIVLALATIGNVLAFQFERIEEIVTTGN